MCFEWTLWWLIQTRWNLLWVRWSSCLGFLYTKKLEVMHTRTWWVTKTTVFASRRKLGHFKRLLWHVHWNQWQNYLNMWFWLLTKGFWLQFFPKVAMDKPQRMVVMDKFSPSAFQYVFISHDIYQPKTPSLHCVLV